MSAPRNGREGNQRGQAMAEFALVIPILVLLMFGMMLAAFYTYRAAAADWGVFLTGVAGGAYNTPADGQARSAVVWPDIRSRLTVGQAGERQVRSTIFVENRRPWILGINLIEAQRAAAFFRLWRFYPGPPTGGIE
jgi:hypothetical protein